VPLGRIPQHRTPVTDPLEGVVDVGFGSASFRLHRHCGGFDAVVSVFSIFFVTDMIAEVREL
jgi:hypothetical protein